MKHLEETPWYICDENDTNYCAYVDTDSNYFNAEPLLNHLYPKLSEMDDNERDDKLEKVALAYQDIITDHYDILAKECFNTLLFCNPLSITPRGSKVSRTNYCFSFHF